MSFAILTIVAILQIVFIVLLLITLALGRVLSDWQTATNEKNTRHLLRAANQWLSGRGWPEDFIVHAKRARYPTVVAVLQRFGSHIGGQAWEELVDMVRELAWFEDLKKRAHSSFWWRRLSATHGYAMVARPEDTPILEKLIRDRNPVVRLATVATIKRVLSVTMLEATLDLADTQQSVVRRYVLETLTSNPGLDLALIQSRLDHPRSSQQLRILLDLVADLGVPSFLSHVLPHVINPDLEVRIAVGRTLGQFPHAVSATSLFSLLEDPAWQVRAQAAAGLGAIGARESLAALRRALEDPSWWVRLRAALGLRRLGEAGREVLQSLRPEDDRYAYEMAGYVLGLDDAAVAQYSGPSAVDYSEAPRHSQAA